MCCAGIHKEAVAAMPSTDFLLLAPSQLTLRPSFVIRDVKNKNEQFTDENALLTQIGLLKEGISRLLEEIKNIRAEFPFTFEKQINDDCWVDEQRSALKKEIEMVLEQKIQFEKSISLIIQTLDL